MLKNITTFVLAMMAAHALPAQEVLTAQQDSLLQVMNDTTYWKSFELGEVVVKSNMPKTRVKGDAMRTLISGSILEKAGSATDALTKIPSLKAEKGSGVEVFGRGAAEVYINTINKIKVAHHFILEYMKMETYQGQTIDLNTKEIVKKYTSLTIPNIAYRIEFQSIYK